MSVGKSARRQAAAGQGRGRGIGVMARRVVVSIVGLTFLLAGVAMVVLPGPGLVAIAAGLAVLATEFAWAERRLHQCRDRAAQATALMTANPLGYAMLVVSSLSMIVAGTILLSMVEGMAMVGVTLLLSGLGAAALALPTVRRRLGLEPDAAPEAT